MSQKPTKSPKKPILQIQTTKVNPGKPFLSHSSNTPLKSSKPTASSPINRIPQINTSDKVQRQRGIMATVISSSQGIESPRSPRSPRNNNNQKSVSPISSGNTSPKKDSNESLKRQIDGQNQFTFQLINKLRTDIVRAETMSGKSAPNSNTFPSPNQYSNLASRLDFIIDDYINLNNKLKEHESDQTNYQPINSEKETIQNLNKQHQSDLENKDNQIKELTDQVAELKDQTEKQNNDIQNLNIALENNNKERKEERDNLEKQLNQQELEKKNLQDRLNDTYKQMEEKGIETDQQRKDREFSSRIREIFQPHDTDESIPGYVRKDVALASALRGIYSTGDDELIKNDVQQLRQSAPQAQTQIEDLTNQINGLKEELRNKDEISNHHENEIRQKQQEIDELKNTIKQKQDEIENQSNQHENEIKELRNTIVQKQDEITNQSNEINELKESIKQKQGEIDDLTKSTSNSEIIEKMQNRLNDLEREKNENEEKYTKERNDIQKAYDDLKNALSEKDNEIEQLKAQTNIALTDDLNASNQDLADENAKLKKDLFDSNNKLKTIQEERDNIIAINQRDYDELQKRLKDFIENAKLTEDQASKAQNKIASLKHENDRLKRHIESLTSGSNNNLDNSELEQKIRQLVLENEELHQQNKDFISNLESEMIAFKKENEEKLKFADQCREILPGEDDGSKLDYANESRYNETFANQVRSLFDNNINDKNNSHSYASLKDNDKEIIELIKSSPRAFRGDNLYEDVTNIFHPNLSNEDIKNHSDKVARAAERFYNSEAKTALNDLFNKASGEELNNLIEQMKQNENESIRKNAEILSDALKDDRMSVEAEGMIATTLAMFLAQIGNESPNQQ